MTAYDALVHYHLGMVESQSSDLSTVQRGKLDRLRLHPLYEHPIMLCIDGLSAIVEGSFVHSEYTRRLDTASQYLCTGLEVFTITEPDLYVSMALLHSRMRLVVYKESVASGALGSMCKLHCLPDINHRFQVYKWENDAV